MTYNNNNKMDASRRQQIKRESKKSLLNQYKNERAYHKVQLDYYDAKIAHLEKMDKLYKEEYGI